MKVSTIASFIVFVLYSQTTFSQKITWEGKYYFGAKTAAATNWNMYWENYSPISDANGNYFWVVNFVDTMYSPMDTVTTQSLGALRINRLGTDDKWIHADINVPGDTMTVFRFYGMYPDNDGGLFLWGNSWQLTVDGTSSKDTIKSPDYDQQIFVIKLDSNLNFEWSRQIVGSTYLGHLAIANLNNRESLLLIHDDMKWGLGEDTIEQMGGSLLLHLDDKGNTLDKKLLPAGYQIAATPDKKHIWIYGHIYPPYLTGDTIHWDNQMVYRTNPQYLKADFYVAYLDSSYTCQALHLLPTHANGGSSISTQLFLKNMQVEPNGLLKVAAFFEGALTIGSDNYNSSSDGSSVYFEVDPVNGITDSWGLNDPGSSYYISQLKPNDEWMVCFKTRTAFSAGDTVEPGIYSGKYSTSTGWKPDYKYGGEELTREELRMTLGDNSIFCALNTPYTSNGSWVNTDSQNVWLRISQTAAGLKDIKSQSLQFDIFPNPSNEYVLIKTPTIERSSIRILNASGIQVGPVVPIKESTTQVQTHELPAGLYFIEMQTPQGSAFKKLVVTH